MHGRVHSSIPHAARRNATRPSLDSLEPGRRLTVGGAVAGVSAPTYAGIHARLSPVLVWAVPVPSSREYALSMHVPLWDLCMPRMSCRDA